MCVFWLPGLINLDGCYYFSNELYFKFWLNVFSIFNLLFLPHLYLLSLIVLVGEGRVQKYLNFNRASHHFSEVIHL